MKQVAYLVLFLASIALPGLAAAQDDAGLRPPYTINPGDVLSISVWKEADLQREVLVRPDGFFSFPLAGQVRAAGRSVAELEDELTRKLSEYIPELVVTVATLQIGGNKVYIIGQVQRPGEYPVTTSVDVMQALAVAGGTTPFAEVNNIRILRRSGEQQTAIPFRYGDVASGKRLEQNIVLQPGDVVVVP